MDAGRPRPQGDALRLPETPEDWRAYLATAAQYVRVYGELSRVAPRAVEAIAREVGPLTVSEACQALDALALRPHAR